MGLNRVPMDRVQSTKQGGRADPRAHAKAGLERVPSGSLGESAGRETERKGVL